MEVETVIRNCSIVRQDGILKAGLAIDKGKVVAIAQDVALPGAREEIDADGKYVLPGVVDAHFHLEYPPGVDPVANISNETKECAAAGCTTIIHLLAPADDIEKRAREFVELYEKNGFVDLALSARIYTMENIAQIESLYDYGMKSVKLLLPYKGSEAVWKGRVGGIDDGIIYFTFQEVGRLVKENCNVFVRVHCENVEIFLKNKEKFLEKKIEPTSWNEVRPRICEEESMAKCLYLAGRTGCPIYIVHMTIKEGIILLKKARGEGIDVTGETCVQYLTANTNNIDKILSKINPPIRSAQDNEELWAAVNDGTIDVVATDHAPVPKELKRNFWDATVGIPGAGTFLPLMLSEGVNKGRITLEKLVDVCCFAPAKKFGLTPKKGMISVGSDADLVLIDLKKEAVVPKRPVFSGSDFSPFAGLKIKGWPILTMLRGNIVAKDGNVTGKSGYGRFQAGK